MAIYPALNGMSTDLLIFLQSSGLINRILKATASLIQRNYVTFTSLTQYFLSNRVGDSRRINLLLTGPMRNAMYPALIGMDMGLLIFLQSPSLAY